MIRMSERQLIAVVLATAVLITLAATVFVIATPVDFLEEAYTEAEEAEANATEAVEALEESRELCLGARDNAEDALVEAMLTNPFSTEITLAHWYIQNAEAISNSAIGHDAAASIWLDRGDTSYSQAVGWYEEDPRAQTDGTITLKFRDARDEYNEAVSHAEEAGPIYDEATPLYITAIELAYQVIGDE